MILKVRIKFHPKPLISKSFLVSLKARVTRAGVVHRVVQIGNGLFLSALWLDGVASCMRLVAVLCDGHLT